MKKYVLGLWVLCLFATAFAEKVVRVGCFDSRFCQRDEFGRISGYAYEFQQEIATYTGWRYEYVDDSWPNLFQMLKEGKIDLLSDVSFVEERAKDMLFSSYAMGAEKYYLYVPVSSEIVSTDFKSLEGKKVGISKGSFQVGLFRKWEDQMGVKTQLVEKVEDDSSFNALLRNGELDALVNVDIYMADEQSTVLAEIGSSDIYFAVNKNRPDLLEELNKAMASIYRANHFYNEDLYKRYIDNQGASKFLNVKELQWLSQKPTIRVGYRDNYMALCGKDEKSGQLKGAMKDYLDLMSTVFKNATIKFEPVAYGSVQDAQDALQAGEVDCIFPVNFGPYDAEQNGMLVSEIVASSDAYAIVHGDNRNQFFLGGHNTIAVNRQNPNYVAFLRDNFPKWKHVFVESTDEALRAVAQKKVSTFLVNSFRLKNLEPKLEKLNLFTVATGHVMYLSFAVRRDNLMLYSILNHGIGLIPREEMNSALISNTLADYNTSVLDVIKQNALQFLFVGCLISLVIVVLLVRTFKSEIKYKRANQNLEESQDHLKIALASAQDASKAKTTFLNSMSHDIRTPMNGIIGMTAIASAHMDDPEKVRDCLKKISGASDHLLSLINDVLDVSRIESGRTTLNSIEFSIDKMFGDITNMIQSQAGQKRQTLVVDMDGLRNRNAVGDPLRLRQIMLNILSNAVKYTPEGGIIKAILSERTSSTPGFGEYLFVCEDNGMGMDPEYVERIFEPFSRDEQDENKRTIQGTGLGMSIARSLARMMDGDIRVDSALGKGTRIEVPFKLKVGAAEGSDATQTSSLDSLIQMNYSGRRLLLVEDNELNMEIAKEFLSSTGARIECAYDGKQAFDMYDCHDAGFYDLIFMDIQMPVMDGHQTTRAIRSSGKGDALTIPIVAMSANAFTEDMETSKRSGMNDHIAKPINVAKLMGLMKKYLG